MSTEIKPIKVWGQGGPNPPKVAFLLEELGIPYETDPIPISDVKSPEYLKINPNGRIPAIYDPNTDLTLWESGAIVEYLIERYDTEQKVSFAPGTNESFHAKQWLFFQVSGQAPYYGQATWFKKFHPEQVPSALTRYVKEMHRVSSVLDEWLAQEKQKYEGNGGDGPWLVGNKFSYADLAFVSWQKVVDMLISKEEYDIAKYPNMNEWLNKMYARKSVEDVWNTMLAAMGRK